MPDRPPNLVDEFARLERRLAKLENVVYRTSTALAGDIDPEPGAALDITGLTATVTPQPDGHAAEIQVTWNPIAADPDDARPDPVRHYELSYRLGTAPWQATRVVEEPPAVLEAIPIDGQLDSQNGSIVDVRVRAITRRGRIGPYAVLQIPTRPTDPEPPPLPQPSTPQLTPQPAAILIRWDGLTATGGTMPPQVTSVEVHAAGTPGNTGRPDTLVTTFTGASSHLLTSDATAYVVLVARDASGNQSAPSGQVHATPLPPSPAIS